MYMHICTHIYIYIFMSICICIYVSMYVATYIYVFTCVHMCVTSVYRYTRFALSQSTPTTFCRLAILKVESKELS